MDVDVDAVFLDLVLLDEEDLELLDQARRALDAVEVLDDLAAQVGLRACRPVLEGAAVEEVEEHLGHVVEHPHHRVGLQAEVVAVEEGLAREGHHLGVLVDHGNQAHALQVRDLALLEVEAHAIDLVDPAELLAGGDLRHQGGVDLARQGAGRGHEEVVLLARAGHAGAAQQVVAGHQNVGEEDVPAREVGVGVHIDHVVGRAQILEVGHEGHLAVVGDLGPLIDHRLLAQVAGQDEDGVVLPQVEAVEVLAELGVDLVDEARVVEVADLLRRGVEQGDVLDLVELGVFVEEGDGTVVAL